jgi:tetratricopeptide (TPR) repeat protein
MEGKDAFPLAQDAVDRAMVLDDSLSEVWASQGLVYLRQNRAPKAAEVLEHAIELDPQNFSAWLWYANSLGGMRRFDEQLVALQTAYSLEPMSRPVNNNLAGGYRVRGDFVRSRQHYERIDQLDDLNPTQYKEAIAGTYFSSGDLDRAIVESRQILAVDPGNTDVMRQLMNAYIALGDLAEADRWAAEAAKIDAFQPLAYEVDIARGDFAGAIVYIEDKMRLLQNRNNLDYLFMLFRAAYVGGQIETAKSYLTEYLGHLGGRVEINPSETFHWYTLFLADFLIKHGDESNGGARQGRKMRDEVLAGLTKLNTQNYQHPDTYYGLALARAIGDDNAGALDALEEAVNKGFRRKSRIEREPALEKLRSETRFRTVMANMDELVASEREQLALATLAEYSPMSERERVVVPREVLEKYVGFYSDGNMLLNVFLDEAGKFMLVPGPLRSFEILAISETEFYTPLVSGDTIAFHTDDRGIVTHINVDNNGAVTRYKAIEPLPAIVELDRSIMQRYEGTYAAQRVSQAADGAADSDIWTGRVSIEEDGKIWLDLDDQPRWEIAPYSETEFLLLGFVARLQFKVNPDTGIADRMLFFQEGVELNFERQQ